WSAGESKSKSLLARPRALASDADFKLLSLDCQGHAALSAHFEAKRYRFFDVSECFLACFTLTDAAGNRRTFGNPHSVLVAIQHCGEFHQVNLTSATRSRKSVSEITRIR